MNKSTEKQIIINLEKDYDDIYLLLRNNLDNQILEKNDKAFLGKINGNQIEIQRKPRFYKNYKPIKFCGQFEKQDENEVIVKGYFKEYHGFNYITAIILILIVNLCEVFILKVKILSTFYYVNLLITLGFIIITGLINFNLIKEDKVEIIEFLSIK